MPKPTLHFAHANGFPAGSYKTLFDELAQDYQLIAIDKLGHNPNYPIRDGWNELAEELIDYLCTHASEPVIGVGHSLGAMITFIAAHKRPELFKQIIMLDPPLAMSYGSVFFKLVKTLGKIDQYSPAGKTQHRIQHWSNRRLATDYFASRALFKHFDPQGIDHYLDAGTDQLPDGSLQLNYRVDVECDIYRTIPHHIECLRQPLQVPGHIIRGSNSEVTRTNFAQRLAKRHHMNYLEFPEGQHLFPLEKPVVCAAFIKELIKR